MRFVQVKSAEQQSQLLLHRTAANPSDQCRPEAILVFGETVRKAGHKLRSCQVLLPNSCHLSYQGCLWG